MAEPAVQDTDSSEPEPGPEPDETEHAEVHTTSVEESGVDPDGYFDGVETESSGDEVDDLLGEDDSGSESTEPQRTMTGGIAGDINEGVARAAVIGLDEEWEEDGETQSKTDLQSEFEETFEAFRLGHYAQICAEEYLDMEEDIHPAWGLIGASLICSAIIVYRRPDGDEMIDLSKHKLGNFQMPSPGGDEDDDNE